jgi:secondary thiamine-phosphate synthase enzyme
VAQIPASRFGDVQALSFETERKTQLLDVTAAVREAVAGRAGSLVTIFVPHTTAGVVVQASGPGATGVAPDIEAALERLIDESWSWKHGDEGDRNPWSHVRAALTASSVTIPIEDGELALGDVQTIFLCEFDGPRRRRILITVVCSAQGAAASRNRTRARDRRVAARARERWDADPGVRPSSGRASRL